MTRTEAIAYIQSHPKMFEGVATETVLARTRSSSDPDYYSPSTYTARESDKIKKKAAPTPAAAPPSAVPLPKSLPSLPSLPVSLAIGLLALGAGMALYRATR